jgi:thioredoxin-like negative regulator of GroEL
MTTKIRSLALSAVSLALLLTASQVPAQTVRPASPPARSLNPLPEVTDLNFHKVVTKSTTATVIIFSGDDDVTSVSQNSILADLADSYTGRVNFVHAILKRDADGHFAAPDAIKNMVAAARVHYVPTVLFVSNDHCNTVTSFGGSAPRDEVVQFIAFGFQECAAITPESRAGEDDDADANAKKTTLAKLNAAQFLRDADHSKFGLGIEVRMKDAGKLFDTLPKEGATKEQWDALVVALNAQRLGSKLPLMIDTVWPGSPGALAKLQKGDLITAVNGQSLDGLTLDQGAEKLFADGKVLLSVTRGTDSFKVAITAGEYLEDMN